MSVDSKIDKTYDSNSECGDGIVSSDAQNMEQVTDRL
jgi:hypothetical protein